MRRPIALICSATALAYHAMAFHVSRHSFLDGEFGTPGTLQGGEPGGAQYEARHLAMIRAIAYASPMPRDRIVTVYTDYKSPYAYLAKDPAWELARDFPIRLRVLP